MNEDRTHRPQGARWEVALAVGAFAVLCAVALAHAPQLVTPDDYAYRASIVGMTDGHFLSLTTAQVRALAAQLTASAGPQRAVLFGPGPLGGSIEQWVRLANGHWISEKDPGYPFLAAPFQFLGIIRLAPLAYAALACAALFFGARRWLGRLGGAVAVGLFCCSGAALAFAWRDYMPTFTEAALIAAGTGALLWVMLATEAMPRRRTWIGLASFLAIEAATFARYTDIVVLGCAFATVLVVRWRRPRSLPAGAAGWWLGSVVLFCAGLAVFNDLVYGGPWRSGYRPGEVQFSIGSIPGNVRDMPSHLLQALPAMVLGLAALACITVRWLRLRHAGPLGNEARRDAAVGAALAASWAGIWGLYAAYTWTTQPGMTTLAAIRFYVPAIGAIALLGAWFLTRLPRRTSAAAATSTITVAAIAGLGIWAFGVMMPNMTPNRPPPGCNIGQPHCPARPPSART